MGKSKIYLIGAVMVVIAGVMIFSPSGRKTAEMQPQVIVPQSAMPTNGMVGGTVADNMKENDDEPQANPALIEAMGQSGGSGTAEGEIRPAPAESVPQLAPAVPVPQDR